MSAGLVPRGRCGRADLLRILAAVGAADVTRIAQLTGYRWVEPTVDTESRRAEGEGTEEPGATRASEATTVPPRLGVTTLQPVSVWQASALTARSRPSRAREPETQPIGQPPAWRRAPDGAPALHPLAAWNDLRQRLRPRLSELCEGSEPDLERTVTRIARGLLLERLPRRRRRRLAACVQLVFDRSERLVPYWSDQDQVAAELARLLPRDAVERAVHHEGCALPRLLDREDAYGPPPAGGIVLVLGDLGSLGAAGESATWQTLGRQVTASGNHPVALVPCRAEQVPAPLRRLWQVVPWERPASVACVDPGAEDPSPAARQRRVQRLLTLLAPALRIEPGLLRALRLAMPEGGYDAALEAAVWQHPAIASTHCEAATLNQDQRRTLLRAFAKQPVALRRRALALLRCWRGHLPPEIWFEELLNLGADFDADLPEPEDLADARRFFAYVCELLELDPLAPTPTGAWVRRVGQRATGLFADPEVGQRLEQLDWRLHRLDASYVPPRPSDPIDFPVPSDGEVHAVIAQQGEALVLGPRAQSEPQSSPLGALVSRNGLVQIRIAHDDRLDPAFWESGEAPPWAARWGWDDCGAWVEFEVDRDGVKPVTQRMRWIEPGSFLMGSRAGEEGRFDDEGPQHAVRIEQGYWLFDTPCTQRLWEAVLGANPSRFEGPARPVEQVSWMDVERFLTAVNARVRGLDLCLPSEAQWEFACRAGSEARWCFGDDEADLGEYAWYDDNGDGETHPVAQKRPNAWGLYDCHGNVDEWVQDAWDDSYEGAPADGSPWESSAPGAVRVIRGGSWDVTARNCRSAYRSYRHPDYRDYDLGFRCARVQGRELKPGSGEAERSDRPRAVPARGSGSGRGGAGPYRGAGGADGERLSDTPPETLPASGTMLRLHTDEGSRIVLPDAPALVLRTDRDELTLRRLPKPGWADAIGRDRFGLWADLRIEAPWSITARFDQADLSAYYSGSAPVIQRLRWIPPGRFRMGSPDDEPGRWEDEGPRHEVLIGQGYWLFDTPCTQALWEAVVGEHQSRFRDPRRPVETVSWKDAQRFAQALQDRLAALDDDGGRIVLPSEAQWEYACRAGSETALYTGPIEIKGDIDNSMDAPVLDPIAWYGGNSGVDYDLEEGEDSTTGDWWNGKQKQYPHTRAGTRRVKLKQPNAWGLYDMLGNVFEWTEDHWHAGYEHAPAKGTAWIDSDAEAGAARVIRGGSWGVTAQVCRSAYRFSRLPDDRSRVLGFRCARVQG